MRRFTAFLITIMTIVAVFAINVISYGGKTGSMHLQTDFTLGLEYKGGYEVLYTVESKDGENSKAVRDDAIDTIINQAEAAGLSDFDVYEEGNNQIRVTFPASSKVAAEAVLGLLESDCQLSFRTTDDESLLDEGITAYEALLTTAGDKAEIATDSNGNVAIQLNLSKDGLDTFNSWITDGKLDIIEDEESSNKGGTEDVVIWFGYTEYDEDAGEEKVDSYNEYKQFVDNGTTFLTSEQKIIYNKYVNKILSVASISADVVAADGLSSREFLLTGNFTRAKANSIIDIINNGGLDYTLERESFARIPATEGTASISTTAIALVIGVLAICVFLVLTYRLPGVAASFTLIAQAGLSLAVYSAFRGLFGPEVIVALLISIFVGTDTFVCLFEKTKDEMYKGKPIERAFDEASKKSNSTIIDATVLSLIVALIVFAVGSGTIRSIATMLAVSMALCLVLTTLLVKLLCNLIFKSMKFEGKYNLFMKRHKDVPNVKEGEYQSFFGYFTKVDFFKNLKKKFKIAGAALLVSVVCGSVWFIANGSPFNVGSELGTYTKVTIQTNITEADLKATGQNDVTIDFGETEAELKAFVTDITGVKPKEVYMVKDKLTENTKIEFMSYVVNFSKVVSSDKLESLVNYLDVLKTSADELNEGSTSYIEADEHIFTYSCNTVKNVTAIRTVLNALLAFGLALVAVFVYTSFRYKFTYAAAISAGLFVDAVIVLGALLLTHLEFSILTVTCILGITCYSVNDKVMLFDKIRENLRGSRKKVFTHEEYVEYSNKALQQSAFRSIIVGSMSILMLVVIMVSSLFNYTLFSIVLTLGIISSVLTTNFLTPSVWIYLENRFSLFMQNKSKSGAKKKAKYEELEEQVFIGIND